MIIDLTRYTQAGTMTEEAIIKASEVNAKPMDVGTHEVVLVDFLKDATTQAIIKFANDPNWIQFTPVLQNSVGAQTRQTIMIPMTEETMYVSKTGEPTKMPFITFQQFLIALGFDLLPLEERFEQAFIKRVAASNGACIETLKGLQAKVVLEWDAKKLHPFYDSTDKCYWIVDATETVCAELAEPFMLNKELKGMDRWAEMIGKCQAKGLQLQTQPYFKILPHDTIKNDLSAFFPVKKIKPIPVLPPKQMTFNPTIIKPTAPVMAQQQEDDVEL